ncbi:MAG: hypothetical protein DMG78_24075 [Acidobacteria bacterium]|nr:MAG: hypothetical protein DMG78_24075 [Acidobacteriota bacterium]
MALRLFACFNEVLARFSEDGSSRPSVERKQRRHAVDGKKTHLQANRKYGFCLWVRTRVADLQWNTTADS